ncbi:hypothetical protein FB390_6357 [Nocardia bhagyanarayanae]|uniref:Uncharacterized protein n=1 Tax=Nocardia bhagyanarayanae TaxID=1215925 RepID=A0A543EX57_9NOCA|nr:hypothetical protein FB390_6357 [Nocardia bhagyanarayanae]
MEGVDIAALVAQILTFLSSGSSINYNPGA